MKKIKLMLGKLLFFYKSCKVKEPIQKDLEPEIENDEFAGADKEKCPYQEDTVKCEPENSIYEISRMPFIVKIENTTEKKIENVSLFFANNQNSSEFSSKGSYVKNGLIISSGILNVTYNHIVKSTIVNKLKVGLTHIVSENQQQVMEKFSIKGQSVNGTSFEKIVTPTIDPYQQQSSIVAVKENYFIDGDTAIIIHKIHPKTTVQIYFYPTMDWNL